MLKRLITFILLIICANSLSAKNLTEASEPGKGGIKGVITTSDKKSAEGVSIIVKELNKSVLSEEGGDFSINNLQPGTYTLFVSVPGFAPISQTVTVEAGHFEEIQLQLSASEKQLQEVVVSTGKNKFAGHSSDYVSKLPLKNLENPQVYSTVTKAVMQEQLATSQDDALKNVTGLYKIWASTGRGGDGGSYFASRGFYTQSMFRDGIAGKISGNADAANIESIESIKGPSATLFGSALTSYGGLVNRVTKSPYETFGGEATATVGSYGLARVTADVNTPLNEDKTALFRVNAAYTTQNSWQDYGFNKTIFLAPSLSLKVNDRLSFKVEAEFMNVKKTMEQTLYFDPNYTIDQLGVNRADKLNFDFTQSYISNDLTVTSKTANFFATMKYKISDNWTTQTLVSSSNNTASGPLNWFYLLPNEQMTRCVYNTDATESVIEAQQNIVGDFKIGNLRNRFVGGIDVYSSKLKNMYGYLPGGSWVFDTVSYAQPNNPNYSNFNLSALTGLFANGPEYKSVTSQNTYSAYASDVLNITGNFMAMAALRVDRFDNKGTYDPNSNSTSGAYQQTALAPKFGLVYQPVKDKVALFANYQSGFQNVAPGQTADENGQLVTTTFKPEEARQYEGGVKLNTFGGRLTGTLSYYDIEVKNMVRANPAVANASVQDGNQLSKGVEAELIANPATGLNIIAGYAYNDSKMTNADASVDGRRPVTAGPKNLVNFYISYHFTRGVVHGLGASFGGNYASENATYNYADLGVFTLPSYTVLNASVFYDQPRYRLTLKVDNLTNKEYFIGWTTINPQMLRRVMASVAVKF